ncbi:MAG: putative porin [Candidatus Latescibacter sp.]|nr:putative porin [Candidatus Latescibacter sp.]
MKHLNVKRAIVLISIIGIFPAVSHSQGQIAFSTGDLVFKGDLRYRHEYIKQENTDQRDRQRLRARLNMTATVDKSVNFIFALASGSSDDPISSNQDLTGGFSDKPIWIDQVYFDWTTPMPGLKIQGGKVKNPFLAVGRNQLIWDHDLNPEGLSFQFTKTAAPVDVFANGSFFWVQERAADKDSYLAGGQAGVKKAGSFGDITLGSSYFDYVHGKGYATFYDAAKSFGNSVDAKKLYLYDYRLVEAFGELNLSQFGLPIGFQGDYVTNVAKDVQKNKGYYIGASLGKTTVPGTWDIKAGYRNLEKDAVIGAFNDSDFSGGGADNKGFVFNADYQTAKNITLNLTWFKNTKSLTNGADYNRVQIDTNFKF